MSDFVDLADAGRRLAHALANIRQDPVGHLTRRLGRGAFVLWAAEIPIPYDRINDTPPAAPSRAACASSSATS